MVQSGNETRHSELNTGVLNYSARGHFLSLPVVALLFGITINSVQGFRFLHILINIYIMFFYKSHPKTSEVMLLWFDSVCWCWIFCSYTCLSLHLTSPLPKHPSLAHARISLVSLGYHHVISLVPLWLPHLQWTLSLSVSYPGRVLMEFDTI